MNRRILGLESPESQPPVPPGGASASGFITVYPLATSSQAPPELRRGCPFTGPPVPPSFLLLAVWPQHKQQQNQHKNKNKNKNSKQFQEHNQHVSPHKGTGTKNHLPVTQTRMLWTSVH